MCPLVKEPPVKFSSSHYPNGVNANFLSGDSGAVVGGHIVKFEDHLEAGHITGSGLDCVQHRSLVRELCLRFLTCSVWARQHQPS